VNGYACGVEIQRGLAITDFQRNADGATTSRT
jgi:hypothetical protein